MNIREYRYILEIARQGGISKAAAVLHISQPSLSGYLKNVEGRLGAKLFDFSGGRVYPTPMGDVYLEYAEQIVGIDAKMMETLEQIRQKRTGLVRIGITGTRSTYLTPLIMKACAEAYPGIELRIYENNTAALENMAVKQRSLDIILVNELPRGTELESRVLSYDQVLLAVPAALGRQLKRREESGRFPDWVDLGQLADFPFVLMRSGHRLRGEAEQLFRESGVAPAVRMETLRADTALAMTSAGMAACFIYDSYPPAYSDPDIMLFRVGTKSMTIPFTAAYLRDSLAFPPVRAVLDTVIQAVTEVCRENMEAFETSRKSR